MSLSFLPSPTAEQHPKVQESAERSGSLLQTLFGWVQGYNVDGFSSLGEEAGSRRPGHGNVCAVASHRSRLPKGVTMERNGKVFLERLKLFSA